MALSLKHDSSSIIGSPLQCAQVTTVQDYVHKNEDRKVTLKTEVSGTTSELYKGFNPEDIFIESKKQGAAQCRATGDPHYTVRPVGPCAHCATPAPC